VREWSVWTSWLVEYSFEEALERLWSGGFPRLELSAEHFNEYLARLGARSCLDAASRARAEALASRGPVELGSLPPVEFVHAHGPFKPFELESIWDLEASVKVVEGWIERCRDLGVAVLVCHPFTAGKLSLEELERLNLSAYRKLARVAEDCGVVLAVENMGRGYGSLASHLLRLTEELSPSVAVCVDTGHANIEAYRGAVHKLVEEVGRAVVATHISDNDGSGDQHLFPGRGTLQWGEVLAALDAVGYRKPLNLEIPGEMRLCPDPNARVDYLKRLIASSGELLNPPKHRLS
jgi:sugar phosphate isomerase/epimerase